MNSLKLIIKRNNLNLSHVIRNKLSIVSLFLFLIFGWALVCFFIPFPNCNNQIMVVPLYLLLILGTLSYEWNNSILKENEIISGINRGIHYISLLLTVVIIGNIMSILLIYGNVILNEIGVVLNKPGFMVTPHTFYFSWEQVSWFALFYAININILLTFGFYFFAYRLFSNKKSYFSLIICMGILMIVFGASLNSYFWFSHYDQETLFGDTLNISYKFDPTKSLFPKYLFVPIAIVFPFYSVFQFFGIVVNNTLTINYPHLSIHNQNYIPFLMNFNDPLHWQWSFVVIMPYIHVLFFGISGIVFSKIKRR